MKSPKTKRGDIVHPCIAITLREYRRSYVHPMAFTVTAVARDGIFCRLPDGRSSFKYKSWIRHENFNPTITSAS